MNIDDKFKELFPSLAIQFPLRPIQKTVIQHVIAGDNTLAILPTGGGKSLIYWMSGLLLDGITFVVSPLTALIDEQTRKLREQGLEVLTIHSGVGGSEQIKKLTDFYNKKINPRFIFASPERIATDGFFEFVMRSRSAEIKLFTVDEAHCVSQWGFDFRPFYKRIPHFIDAVFPKKLPSVLALTATINPKDVGEIRNDFNIQKVVKDDYLLRHEIQLKAIKLGDENEKEDKLWQLLEMHRGEKAIVYLYRKYAKRGAADFAGKATEKGFSATCFHGDMSAQNRQEIIDGFKSGNYSLIFATNAFGMGIDIPDIRVVIHFMIPESVEQYYQEIGRAARDGKAAVGYILYTNKNVAVRKSHFIDKSFPSSEELSRVHKKISNNMLGLKTLQYFDDEEIQSNFPYFLQYDIVSIVAKGFTNLKVFSNIDDKDLANLYSLTTAKGVITTMKKSGKSAQEIFDLAYSAVLSGKAKLAKSFDKCIVIDNHFDQLPKDKLVSIEVGVSEKKQYKYDLLDYLKYLLDNCDGSNELHQEIGLYLGMEKHKLNCIYKTLKGHRVRSKSEVIIANLLHSENIKYEYEKKLYYAPNKWIEPDFTVYVNGKEIYWEHLGLLGTESYDKRWLEKKTIYNDFYNGRLVTTYESAVLTDSAVETINLLKSF